MVCDRSRRHEAGEPVTRRVQRDGRDRRALVGEAIEVVRTDAPPDATRRPATSPSTSGMGARTAPNRSATSSRSSSDGAAAAERRSAPIAGPPSAPNASQSSRSNPPVSSDVRTTAGGHSLAKKRAERLDELLLLLAEREVHGYARTRGEGRGQKVAGMRYQPPTIAQSGYSSTPSSAIS